MIFLLLYDYESLSALSNAIYLLHLPRKGRVAVGFLLPVLPEHVLEASKVNFVQCDCLLLPLMFHLRDIIAMNCDGNLMYKNLSTNSFTR